MRRTDAPNELSYQLARPAREVFVEAEIMNAWVRAREDCLSKQMDNVNEYIEIEDYEL